MNRVCMVLVEHPEMVQKSQESWSLFKKFQSEFEYMQNLSNEIRSAYLKNTMHKVVNIFLYHK